MMPLYYLSIYRNHYLLPSSNDVEASFLGLFSLLSQPVILRWEAQSMKIYALDYMGRHYETGIDHTDIKSIHVLVVTGDEILDITLKDGTVRKFDPIRTRRADYYDDEYDVTPEDDDLFYRWMHRTDTYDPYPVEKRWMS